MNERNPLVMMANIYANSSVITENQKAHLGNALLFMIRYSLGRKTSADMASLNAIKSLFEFIPDNHKKLMIEEIEMEMSIDNRFDYSIWGEALKILKDTK